MLESIGMIATLKNVAADLTNRVLKLVQINEKSCQWKPSNTKDIFNYIYTAAGKLMSEIQVIPVRTTAKYTIASFKLQLVTVGIACWQRSGLLLQWVWICQNQSNEPI